MLGTTGIGHGIAIPHGKLPGLDRVYGVFAKLERAVDFDAIDNQPVDLIFLLLAPANCGADHLKGACQGIAHAARPDSCAKRCAAQPAATRFTR